MHGDALGEKWLLHTTHVRGARLGFGGLGVASLNGISSISPASDSPSASPASSSETPSPSPASPSEAPSPSPASGFDLACLPTFHVCGVGSRVAAF